MPGSRTALRSAFTLIELLVVVAMTPNGGEVTPSF